MEIFDFLFWTIGLLTALCAIAVVVTQNIVRSASWLLFTLGGVAALFFLLGADIVAAIQLLVYVGGTLILVVFGVMLTAQGPFLSMRAGAAEWAISAVAGFALFGVLAITAVQFREKEAGPPPGSTVAEYAPKTTLLDMEHDELDETRSQYSALVGQALLGVGLGPAHKDEPYPAKRQARDQVQKKENDKVIRAHYLLPFEIISVHLLVVLIGAAYLARAKRRRRETT